MNRLGIIVPGSIALLVFALVGIVWAQASSSYDNRWHVLSAGGSQDMASSEYTIHGTSGQFAIGPASGGQSGVGSGYWYGIRLCEPITRVDFDWTPPSPETGEVVTFTVTAILPITATPLITYEWGFGDSGSATGDPVYHTYILSDTYTVNLTATNECGGPVVASHDVTVTGPVVTPTYGVELTPPTASDSGAPGDTVIYKLTVRNTGDTADTIDLSYVDVNGWTSGVTPAQVGLAPDGTAPVTVTVDIPSGAGDGDFDVAIVTATSQGDGMVSDSSTLTSTAVVACVPVAGADLNWAPPEPQVGDSVTFSGTVTAGDAPVTYTWDFGDGSAAQTGNPLAHTFPITPTVQTYTVTMGVDNVCQMPQQVAQAVTVRPSYIYLPVVMRAY